MTHDLKCDPTPFADLASGAKTCDLRPADRPFAAGDELLLREWIPPAACALLGRPSGYTGRELRALVTHVQRGYGLPETHVALSLRLLPDDVLEPPRGVLVAAGARERVEDMSQLGRLQVIVEPDGDVLVSVSEDRGDGLRGPWSSVEFCEPSAGGGHSPATHAALRALAAAIDADAASRPAPGAAPRPDVLDALLARARAAAADPRRVGWTHDRFFGVPGPWLAVPDDVLDATLYLPPGGAFLVLGGPGPDVRPLLRDASALRALAEAALERRLRDELRGAR